MSDTRRRSAAVFVRFLPDEHQALAQAAAERGIGVCEFIRAAIRNELEAQR